MNIIIAGGTGFIGRALVHHLLNEGDRVVLLSRKHVHTFPAHQNLSLAQWDAATPGGWENHLDGVDAVINLAGELIAGKRWSAEQKRRILDSRLNATHAIVEAIRQANHKPSVLINASAVGYYGNIEEGDVAETHRKGTGFLSDVCEQWEQAAMAASLLGVRVVMPRFGVVLDTGGGALPRLLLPFRLGAGGWLGSGTQWFPWVHLDDVVGSILFAIENNRMEGAFNVTAPEPVPMKEFCSQLGKVMKRPSWLPVPGFALKIALGEMSEMLLTGQRAIPKKLSDLGYKFQYPKLTMTLQAILKK
ncbi:MAG: TIGR01777 family protein [Bacteroidetes bacterium]|nr:MAG: TIGR01777 family protein [Bacteroidota bacterium]